MSLSRLDHDGAKVESGTVGSFCYDAPLLSHLVSANATTLNPLPWALQTTVLYKHTTVLYDQITVLLTALEPPSGGG